MSKAPAYWYLEIIEFPLHMLIKMANIRGGMEVEYSVMVTNTKSEGHY